jgi:hypothetical protein
MLGPAKKRRRLGTYALHFLSRRPVRHLDVKLLLVTAQIEFESSTCKQLTMFNPPCASAETSDFQAKC